MNMQGNMVAHGMVYKLCTMQNEAFWAVYQTQSLIQFKGHQQILPYGNLLKNPVKQQHRQGEFPVALQKDSWFEHSLSITMLDYIFQYTINLPWKNSSVRYFGCKYEHYNKTVTIYTFQSSYTAKSDVTIFLFVPWRTRRAHFFCSFGKNLQNTKTPKALWSPTFIS